MKSMFSLLGTFLAGGYLVAGQIQAAPAGSGPQEAVQTPEIHAQGIRLLSENMAAMESLVALGNRATNETSALQAVPEIVKLTVKLNELAEAMDKLPAEFVFTDDDAPALERFEKVFRQGMAFDEKVKLYPSVKRMLDEEFKKAGLLADDDAPDPAKPAAASPVEKCRNGQRYVASAVEAWAMEENIAEGAATVPQEVIKYFKGGVIPTCPEGNKPFAIPATVGAPVVCPVNPAHNIR